MTAPSLSRALECAVEAAQAAGGLLRDNHHARKKIHAATQHDIKLELDVRCQKRVEGILRRAFPEIPILGEEGVVGNPDADTRWVVDPIDGTVNFAYGIPHCCTAIALQTGLPPVARAPQGPARPRPSWAASRFQTVLGVIYDPFCNELWTVRRGRGAQLNGRAIRASTRTQLSESLVGVGFSKERATVRRMIPLWLQLLHRVRKMRSMGSAALGLAYVASGRLDAYVEYGLRIWDIAAGGLLVQAAKGHFETRPLRPAHCYQVLASNGPLHRNLSAIENRHLAPPRPA